MAEYIEREALKAHLKSYVGMFTDELGFVVNLIAVLDGVDFQPAADVVEVCRCKDCKYFYDRECVIRKDSWGGTLRVGQSDFCSDGERRGTE